MSAPGAPLPQDLPALLTRQREAFLRDGPPTAAARRGDLQRLKKGILRHREEFVAAASADFGHRSRHETLIADIYPTVQSIRYLIRHLGRWMRPERRSAALHFLPARLEVHRQPLGVVGVISPWNYPVFLALTPLATAIAAGNRVMLKPSEQTPATSALLARLIGELFPGDQVSVVQGGSEAGAAFAALPFDHLLFTGGGRIGQRVMRQASENLVPVTLELGGKSPAIVARGYPLERAARAIAWGKLFNAGQTCVAPDYALVPAEEVEAFAAVASEEATRLYPAWAANADYTGIVSDRHHARLLDLVADARRKGARVIEVDPGADGPGGTVCRKLAPTLLLDVTDEMVVMREEVFGPVLPIIPYATIEEAIARVNRGPRPLALYFFGDDSADRRAVLARTTSGGVCINDTQLQVLQDDLPFGGIGASGMGAYHGREGFLTFSHSRAVMYEPRFNLPTFLRPPYGRLTERLLRWLLR